MLSAIRILAIWLTLFNIAPAYAGGHAHGISSGSIAPESVRSVVNINFFSEGYQFINQFNGGSNPNPYGNWSSLGGAVFNSTFLDTAGYPCWVPSATTACANVTGSSNPANGKTWFLTWGAPASTNYGGVICYQGIGSGTGAVNIQSGSGTYSTVSSQYCAGYQSGGSFCDGTTHGGSGTATLTGSYTVQSVDESQTGWCIALQWTGTRAGGTLNYSHTDPSASGAYLRALAWYEQADGARFVAGKLFRTEWLQQIVTLDPAALRMMNWVCGNNCAEMDFRNRASPKLIGFGGNYNTPYLLPYGDSAGTNVITLAGVTGTPVPMTHGEKVQFVAGGTQTNFGVHTISAITIPVSGTLQFTTTSPHGFTAGVDQVFFLAGFNTDDTWGVSSSLLNYYTATVSAVEDSTDFQITFANTAGITPCASSSACNMGEGEYFTLNVAGRGAYGLLPYGANYPWAYYSVYALQTNQAYTFCFNKNLPTSSDGAGNFIYGAWVACSSSTGNGGGSGQNTAVPLEVVTELFNELNALGPVYPINPWIVLPPMGMTCNSFYCDPNTTVGGAMEWPANAICTIMNGANGYAGLAAPAQLIVQPGGNELWNNGDGQSSQLAWRGYLLWPSIGNNADYDSGSEFIAQNQMYDIKSSPCMGSRVHFVDGGFVITSEGEYSHRITGSGLAGLSDARNPYAGVAPIMQYDYGFVVAPYINSADQATLIGTDASPGTLATQWFSDVQAGGFNGTAAQADLTAMVADMTNGTSNGGTFDFAATEMTTICTLTSTGTTNNGGVAYNKPCGNYEGGWNTQWINPVAITGLSCTSGTVTVTANLRNTQTGAAPITGSIIEIENLSASAWNGIFTVVTGGSSSFTYSTGGSCPAGTPSATNWQGNYGDTTFGTNAFIIATVSSTQWGTATVNFFNTFTGTGNYQYMPSIYVLVQAWFGWAYPDTFGNTTIEGGGYFPGITAIGNNNRAKSNWLLKRDLDPVSNDNSPVGLDKAA